MYKTAEYVWLSRLPVVWIIRHVDCCSLTLNAGSSHACGKTYFSKNIISCNRLEMSESLSISLEYMKYIRSYDTVHG